MVQLFWGCFLMMFLSLLKPHILIHFFSKSCMIGKGKKESKSSKQPAASQQYIYQYKIQYIIPNTFSNKESIAQEDSLHNQLKNFISYPLIVWGGGGEGCFLFLLFWGTPKDMDLRNAYMYSLPRHLTV